ncbi:MAG: twin-arginine translocation signal domain-containing protein, partial [Burkholderiaceae bacterium]|nr:twin-arginine translocation signal domain-containing protein [Burkholderiaceae bacterium]
MDTITRRQFLKATGAGALGVAATSLTIEDIANAAITRPLPLGTPILVVVTLYGGNDGLNTVVPASDALYRSLRPGISYSESELLPLSEGLFLNGSMTGMHNLWNRNQVAIIRGVGYPNSDRSHFSSMAIWQSASLTAAKTGWLGRWVETQPEDPLLAIGLGSVLPPLLAGEKRSGSVLPLGGLKVPTGSLASDCLKLAVESRSDNVLQSMAARSMRNLFSVSDDITPILKAPAPIASDLPTVMGGNAGGDSNLTQQLDIVAKLVSAGAPT